MAHSAEVGSELGADHRLIELLCRQLKLVSDAAHRQAMADKIAGIIDWHETFDRAYLGFDDRVDDRAEDRAGDQADESGESTAQMPIDALLARARRHIRQEEDHTLPAFESRVHWMVLEDLGERAREIRLARAAR